MHSKFINSESVEIDGQKMIYLSSPHLMIENIFEVLSSIGSKKFFSNPDEKIKKIRESMAESFFALALKMDSGQNWWIMQPEKDPPDFILTSWTENPITIALAPFELVEIPVLCKSFEEMMRIVKKKLEKGYPKNYHLLIFVNNENSTEWINLINVKLSKSIPFQTLWTLHLLGNKETEILSSVVVNKLRPLPIKHIEISFDNPELFKFESSPSFMELVEDGDRKFLRMNSKFANALRKEMMKTLYHKKS